MPENVRLFIASSLPEPVSSPVVEFTRQVKSQLANEPHAPHPRWIPPENWHLTWQFLGQTPVEQLPSLKIALESALARQKALTTHWRELAWWPSRRRAQIMVGLLQDSPALQALSLSINQATTQAIAQTETATSGQSADQEGCNLTRAQKKQKPFNPHITIARLKERNYRGPVPELPPMPSDLPSWRIVEVTLFKSELQASGAIHTPIHTVYLPISPED